MIKSVRYHRWRLLSLLPPIALVVSVLFIHWLAGHERTLIRNALPREAYATLTALNHNRFKAFNGTPAEAQTPEYARLRSQLSQIAEMHPDWAGCFVLRRRPTGEIYFFMDVKPSNQPGERIPHGEVYADCPEAVAAIFDNPEGKLVGPYSDRYGDWVTALFPLVEPGSGSVLCVIGIDLTRADYYKMMVHAVLPWLLFAVVLVVGLILWCLLDVRRKYSRRPYSKMEAVCTFLVGLTISLMLFHAFYRIDTVRTRLEFSSIAHQKARRVVQDLSMFRDVELELLGQAVKDPSADIWNAVDDRIEQGAIASHRRPWAWLSRVSAGDREAFETVTGLSLTERDAREGAADDNPSQALYPIARLSKDAIWSFFDDFTPGQDLSRHALLGGVIEEAVQTGLPCATPVLSIGEGETERRILFVLKAVTDPASSSEIAGLLLFVLEPDQLLDAALGMFPDRSEMVNVSLYAFDAPDGKMKLAAQTGAGAPEILGCQIEQACEHLFLQPIVAFGRTFAIVVSPAPPFFDVYREYSPVFIFSLGVLLSLLLARIVYGWRHLQEELHAGIEARTRSLQASERRYKSLAEDISDIIWELDAETCRFAYVSPAIFDHLGIHADDIVGSSLEECGLFMEAGNETNVIWKSLQRIQDGHTEEIGALHSSKETTADHEGHNVYFETVYRYSRNEKTGRIMMRGVSRNVTAKRHLEIYNDLSLIALQALVKTGDFKTVLKDLAADIQRVTGMSSVGIRLASGDDYPYVATAGLEAAEIEQENSLLVHQDGHVQLDATGHPVLRCLCGEVLMAPPRVNWPRTSYGTVWMNNFSGTFVADREGRHIPVCAHCGYRSMAIVPIRIRDEPVGLLKLSSTHKGEFNDEIIAFIEALAFHIGESMERRRVQNYYSLLFDEMSEAVVVAERKLDADRRLKDLFIVSVNPAFNAVFGVSEADVLMKPLSKTLPSVYTHVRETADAAIREDQHKRCQYHDAVLGRNFEMTLFPVGNSEFAIITSDVTSMSKAEQSLQESRRQYATLIANVPGIVFRCKYDRDRTMEFISDGVQEISDYAPDDFYSGPVTYNAMIDPAYRKAVREHWREALAEQSTFNMEYGIIAKDGGRRWVIERGVGVFDHEGRVLALEGFVFDITERKEAEQATERFAKAIEQSRDAIVITNENGVILYANSAIQPLTGYTRDEITGKILAEFESPPIDSELYHTMWKTLYKGQTWEANFPNRRKNGNPYSEHVVISPVYDEGGTVQNFVCICRDVTQELKDAEERESLRSQLVQATKMESVGRLAGGVAHDFNNMLQGILGYSEMALAQLTAENPVHADVRSIQDAARRAAELTKQLLIFARRSKKHSTVFGVSETIDSLSSLLRRLIGAEVRFDWKPSKVEIAIKADRSQFEQAITNLCINARDAIGLRPGGRVELSVSRVVLRLPRVTFSGTLSAGAYASILVKDNGTGIAAENLPQLFEPFFTTKEKGKGTGLGLAMVYGIVKSSGGGILVQSEEGRGTTFELLFPASDESVKPGLSETDEKSARDFPKGNGETILLVDDEETVLLTTRRMLESLEYTVLATSSAHEAVKIAREKRAEIALVLTDVIMPELNGPEMVRRMLEFLPNLPCLYMSGYTANLLAEQGVPNRPIGNIHKPFSRTTLAEKLHKCLAQLH